MELKLCNIHEINAIYRVPVKKLLRNNQFLNSPIDETEFMSSLTGQGYDPFSCHIIIPLEGHMGDKVSGSPEPK